MPSRISLRDKNVTRAEDAQCPLLDRPQTRPAHRIRYRRHAMHKYTRAADVRWSGYHMLPNAADAQCT